MGIVAADENGLHRRDVLLPAARSRDGASVVRHHPIGKWLLVVEMDKDHAWAPCRIVPMDGRSAGSPGWAAACRVHVRCLVAGRQLDLCDLETAAERATSGGSDFLMANRSN